jgi:hypothetical protein
MSEIYICIVWINIMINIWEIKTQKRRQRHLTLSHRRAGGRPKLRCSAVSGKREDKTKLFMRILGTTGEEWNGNILFCLFWGGWKSGIYFYLLSSLCPSSEPSDCLWLSLWLPSYRGMKCNWNFLIPQNEERLKLRIRNERRKAEEKAFLCVWGFMYHYRCNYQRTNRNASENGSWKLAAMRNVSCRVAAQPWDKLKWCQVLLVLMKCNKLPLWDGLVPLNRVRGGLQTGLGLRKGSRWPMMMKMELINWNLKCGHFSCEIWCVTEPHRVGSACNS